MNEQGETKVRLPGPVFVYSVKSPGAWYGPSKRLTLCRRCSSLACPPSFSLRTWTRMCKNQPQPVKMAQMKRVQGSYRSRPRKHYRMWDFLVEVFLVLSQGLASRAYFGYKQLWGRFNRLRWIGANDVQGRFALMWGVWNTSKSAKHQPYLWLNYNYKK